MTVVNPKVDARDTYFEKLANAKNNLSHDDDTKLSYVYDNVVQLLGTPLSLNLGTPSKEIKTAFIKAGGHAKLAEAFNEQASTFRNIQSADVDWSRLFSKKGGYPDLSLQACDVASNLPQNYYPENYEVSEDIDVVFTNMFS